MYHLVILDLQFIIYLVKLMWFSSNLHNIYIFSFQHYNITFAISGQTKDRLIILYIIVIISIIIINTVST